MEPAEGLSIDQEVLAIVERVSRRPIVPTLDSELIGDLGLDSLQILEFIAELEDHFNISIPLNDIQVIKTVSQVVDRVRLLLERRAQA